MSNCFTRLGLTLLLLSLVLTGCATSSPRMLIEDPEISQVWPQPPDEPRIKLLRILKGADDLVAEKAQRASFFRWLTGESSNQVQLVTPYGVATNGGGLIWVTDPGNQLVHSFDLHHRRAGYIATAGESILQTPSGIVYDRARERLYVADSSVRRVFIFSVIGEPLGEVGSADLFQRPAGLALDSAGNLLVADVLRGLILRFSPDGDVLPSFGSAVTGNGLFNRPLNLAVDPLDRVYVVDSLNFRIEVLDSAGQGVGIIGGLGDVPGTFARPRGVALDSRGHVYVSDAAFDNIQIFNQQGKLLLVFGSDSKYRLSLPASLFIDLHDRLYAVDTFNHQIQIYQFLESVD